MQTLSLEAETYLLIFCEYFLGLRKRDLPPTRCRNPQWSDELDKGNIDLFLKKLGELLKIKFMWPHPGELLFHGAKIPTLKHLTIVSKRLGHKFPDFKLAEPDDIRFCNNPNIVFKRSFSNDAEHVLFHNTEDRSKKVQVMKDELRLHYTDQMHLKPRWFMVPLIPHMQSAGEIHSFVVGGKLVYSVLTWVQEDGNVAFQAAPGVPRLADMRQ